MPKTYGQVQPPWFFLLPSYWQGGSRNANLPSSGDPNAYTSLAGDTAGQLQPLPHTLNRQAGPGEDAAAYVELANLSKTYVSPDGSSRVAVQGLNMQLAAGRVAALLGRNGAGKSTVMHMLTGEDSTSITYLSCGLYARKCSLGCCPLGCLPARMCSRTCPLFSQLASNHCLYNQYWHNLLLRPAWLEQLV
jgi:hypothetical protein